MGWRDRFKAAAKDAARSASTSAAESLKAKAAGRSPNGVPPHWWQLPTLAPGGRGLNVVGESNYQPALERVANGRTTDGCNVTRVMGQLVREPKNRHDPNAVRVDVDGRTVGYVPRDVAPELHHVLDHLSRNNFPATCRAELTGGWDRGWNDRGSIGCVLDVAEPLAVFDAAVDGALPEGTRVSVTREEHYRGALLALLGDASERDVAAWLQIVEADPHVRERAPAIEVRVGDAVIGYLTGKMSNRHAPLLAFAQERGLPATTRTLITQGPKKLEAFVRLPTDPRPFLSAESP